MLLRRIPLLAVQTHEHANRLSRLGVPEARLRVTGNMKYDLAQLVTPSEQAREIRAVLGYGDDEGQIEWKESHAGRCGRGRQR